MNGDGMEVYLCVRNFVLLVAFVTFGERDF